ncbi:MAG TPA: antibiotic biosynthesis monooxygenase family protein [Micromonosporaceae bacterium]|nr:antibiotic biosynthesis monooxygenase family protein [Micromonosporaceae bacterium]
MFVAVFEYEVDADHVAEFETVYGPAGDWARLFVDAPGYLGTELLRDQSRPGRYLVVDRWTSADAYDMFLRTWGEEYAARSDHRAYLYRRETALGRFVATAT